MTTYSYSSPGGITKITVGATDQLQAGRYDIVAYGASGGAVGRNSGGYGAEEGGYFNLVQGDKLEIIAAGAGKSSQTGSGGGASQVFISRDGGAYVPLVIAGGGGGAGTDQGAVGHDATVGVPGNGAGGFGGNRGGGGAGAFSNGEPAGTAGGGYDIADGGGGGTGGSFQSGGFGGGGGGDGGGGGGYTGGDGGGAGFAGYGGTSFVSTTYGAPDPSHTRSGTLGVTGNGMVVFTALCFVTGTRISTTRGQIAVEDLVAGDVAVISTGEPRPVVWIAHRTIKHPTFEQGPVRIVAHAFGQGLPARELYLSPGHPVLVGADEDGDGGHLVPIMCLINGTTIDRVEMDSVTYWHVELDEHDILLAEGLPAESYIDLGSRPWFDGADGALYDPDMALPGMPGRCRPVAIDGPVVEAERRRLDAVFAMRLASAAAWPVAEDALAL